MTLLLFLFGLGLLALGGELLVRGAAGIALAIGLTPLIVGLTVVAAGTSAPEMAVSVQAGLDGFTGIALGNVIGSNIANVFLILGFAALLKPFAVPKAAIRRDLPLVLAATLLLMALSFDGSLTWADGLVLVASLVVSMAYTIVQERKVAKETAEKTAEPATLRTTLTRLGMILAGLVALVLGARWVVAGAVEAARALGWSELVIGLTIVAVGTSLPELMASSVASLKGEGGIAVGNVFGSNLFNILGVLGVTLLMSPSPLAIGRSMLSVDMVIALLAVALCFPLFIRGYRINRVGAVLLLSCFVGYTWYALSVA